MSKAMVVYPSAETLFTQAKELQERAADAHRKWREAERLFAKRRGSDAIEVEELRQSFGELSVEFHRIQHAAQEQAICERNKEREKPRTLVRYAGVA